MLDSTVALAVALAGWRALNPPPPPLSRPKFVDATVNPGDDDDDEDDDGEDGEDGEDGNSGKGGGSIDPDDDEGYGDDDDDDDEEPLQVASMASTTPRPMLRRTIPAPRSARPVPVQRCVVGPVGALSPSRHTAWSYWRATPGNRAPQWRTCRSRI